VEEIINDVDSKIEDLKEYGFHLLIGEKIYKYRLKNRKEYSIAIEDHIIQYGNINVKVDENNNILNIEYSYYTSSDF
jgi:hypothetical protein